MGTATKWEAWRVTRACRSAVGSLEISGASTRQVAPASRGPSICQTESTNVGAVWKHTTSSSDKGKHLSIQSHLLRIPARTVGLTPPLQDLSDLHFL